MIKTAEEIAMIFECFIRKCYNNCERYQHNADTDIYRKLRQLYIESLLKANDSDSICWEKYNKQVDIVLTALRKALSKANKNELLPMLELANSNQEVISIDVISFALCEIVEKSGLFEEYQTNNRNSVKQIRIIDN